MSDVRYSVCWGPLGTNRKLHTINPATTASKRMTGNRDAILVDDVEAELFLVNCRRLQAVRPHRPDAGNCRTSQQTDCAGSSTGTASTLIGKLS